MDEIKNMIAEINPYAEVDSGTDLIQEAVLDSMGIICLISALEMSYDIEIPGEELVPENFRTLSAIAELALKYKGGPNV